MNDTELHAFVDGQLTEAERGAFEALLPQQPELAERVRAYAALNDTLHGAFDDVLDEAIPSRLLKQPPTWRSRVPVFARAASLVAVGLLAGWFGRGLMPSPATVTLSLPHQAAVAHVVYSPEVRHPVEVNANEEDHLVRWLSKRLGTELKRPNLSAYGFELVGGRLLSGPNGPVAHFMFQDARGTRLTLYVSARSDTKETAFRYSREDRISVFYWIDGRFGYALSGEMGREQLLNVANAVYQQLNP